MDHTLQVPDLLRCGYLATGAQSTAQNILLTEGVARHAGRICAQGGTAMWCKNPAPCVPWP